MPRTQSFHKYQPLNSTTAEAPELSSSGIVKRFVVIRDQTPDNCIEFNIINVNSVVACYLQKFNGILNCFRQKY
jgi:hypothetical protein